MGSWRTATLRRAKLASMPAMVSAVGKGRVRPAEALRPMAQPTSRRPETRTRSQGTRVLSRRLVLTGYGALVRAPPRSGCSIARACAGREARELPGGARRGHLGELRTVATLGEDLIPRRPSALRGRRCRRPIDLELPSRSRQLPRAARGRPRRAPALNPMRWRLSVGANGRDAAGSPSPRAALLGNEVLFESQRRRSHEQQG